MPNTTGSPTLTPVKVFSKFLYGASYKLALMRSNLKHLRFSVCAPRECA